jgi:hypothetical protein
MNQQDVLNQLYGQQSQSGYRCATTMTNRINESVKLQG